LDAVILARGSKNANARRVAGQSKPSSHARLAGVPKNYLTCRGLVDADVVFQSHDCVFHVQLAPLKLYEFQIVDRRVGQRFANFLF
jgi:hypothetical protein